MTRRLNFGEDTPLFTDALTGGDDPLLEYTGDLVGSLIDAPEDSWKIHRYLERIETLYPGLSTILDAIELSDRYRTPQGNSMALRGGSIALLALALEHREFEDDMAEPEGVEGDVRAVQFTDYLKQLDSDALIGTYNWTMRRAKAAQNDSRGAIEAVVDEIRDEYSGVYALIDSLGQATDDMPEFSEGVTAGAALMFEVLRSLADGKNIQAFESSVATVDPDETE